MRSGETGEGRVAATCFSRCCLNMICTERVLTLALDGTNTHTHQPISAALLVTTKTHTHTHRCPFGRGWGQANA